MTNKLRHRIGTFAVFASANAIMFFPFQDHFGSQGAALALLLLDTLIVGALTAAGAFDRKE